MSKYLPQFMQGVITVVVSLVTLLLMTYVDLNSNDITYFLCVLNVLFFIIQFCVLLYRTQYLFHPLSLFSIFLYLFSSGQIILKIIGIESERFSIFNRLETSSLNMAIVFITICYAFFQMGILIGYKPILPNFNDLLRYDLKKDITLYHVGGLLLLIGVVPFTVQLINNLQVVLGSGYRSYYQEGVRLSNIFTGLSYYFYVGLIFIACSSFSKRYTKVCFFVLVFISGLRFVSGDRGDGLILLFCSFFIYLFFIKRSKFSLKQVFVIFVFVPFVTPIVDVWRNTIGSQDSFYNTLKQTLSDSNAYVLTLENLGGTLYPLGKLIGLFPDYFQYTGGRTYLASLFYIIPSVFRFGILDTINNNLMYSSPANWLQQNLKLSYGQGFSPFAEMYMNFGFISIFFMMIFGYIITKVFLTNFRFTSKNCNIAIMIVIFFLFSMSARGSSNFMISFYIRYTLVPVVIYNFVKGGTNNERNTVRG
ncbi:O-antigen polysaccharide polymerase Wzy [Enterococcus dongliensis]|uniref:O-antigen polysaccharide polymerase Wzy n=1 Tax=Enterococcus dongliensis TaxID=2559925 RepID=UPI00288E42DC|nr:O-antigen polysaccharide polymerase Wzy [Enterococcus dongliensis]MDT2646095.1 O-antigen polysaccharide polymerase Wzy [Enterococcus dongliensis]